MANGKPKIDGELIEAFHASVSLPSEQGDLKRAAGKVVADCGIESLKIVEVDR